MVTVLAKNPLYTLSVLASLILRLSEKGVCSPANTECEETHIYALPHSSLSAVALFPYDGSITLAVRDGGVDRFRLHGAGETDIALECNGSVTVYEGV